jgi:hypothetical protein
MRKTLFLSAVIAFAISSCQKHDTAAEAQLGQRKTELDAREDALVQREEAIDEREKAVAEREKAVATTRVIQSQAQRPDAAQAEAERQRRIQQLPPEIKALIPDRSRMEAARAEKETATQQRAVQTQKSSENARKQKMSAITALQPGASGDGTNSPSSPSSTPQ